jgi:aspartyl-tRNA(Asn)/glutamyl-tRNA(Gln) amidotransferase subunit C
MAKPGDSVRQEGPRVSEELTRKVARLARLSLTEAEITLFSAQLEKIMQYVDQLNQVTIPEGLSPLRQPLPAEVIEAARLRADHALPSPVQSDGSPTMLESAPDASREGFRVPQIV